MNYSKAMKRIIMFIDLYKKKGNLYLIRMLFYYFILTYFNVSRYIFVKISMCIYTIDYQFHWKQ